MNATFEKRRNNSPKRYNNKRNPTCEDENEDILIKFDMCINIIHVHNKITTEQQA